VDFEGETSRNPCCYSGTTTPSTPSGASPPCTCRAGNGRLWGPGVLDMKSGIVLMPLLRIQGLRGVAWSIAARPITVLLVSDEEVGKRPRRGTFTEGLAKRSSAVLVLEPSYGPKGAVKTAPEGRWRIQTESTGVASHFRTRLSRKGRAQSSNWRARSWRSRSWSTGREA